MIKPALLLLALVLGGCASPSGVERPAIDLPVEWRTPVAGPTDKPAPWELLLAEPELRALVDEALASNRNLRATAARVDQAAATFGVQRSARFPQLAAQASGSRGMTSSVRGADNSIYSSGQLGGILSWELDLWGRMADASEASRQNWLSSEEALAAARVSLVSQVAKAWLQLLQYDEQHRVATSMVGKQRETLVYVQKRFDAGIASLVDMNQANSGLAGAEASLADISRLRSQTENALSVLLGKPPQAIPRQVDLMKLPRPQQIPAGLPADLIINRPDVRAAERTLESTQRSVSAAKKAWLPGFSLTGMLGWVSPELSRVLADGTQAWSAGGAVSLPIFNGGSLASQLDLAEARQREAAERYVGTVLQALGEVEDALVGHQRISEQAGAFERRAQATRERLRLAELRYRAGVIDYAEVLYAQQELLSAELAVVQARGSIQITLIQLYAALGG